MKTFSIFHLDSERGMRGGERQLLYLAGYLRGRGHANTIVCRKGGALDAEAGRMGLRRLHLPFLCEWDPVSAALLRRAARQEARKAKSPVILHAHTAHAAALARLASICGGPPWVAHRRVDFAASRPGRRLKYAKAGRMIAVSAFVKNLLIQEGIPRERIAVVPDCIPLAGESGETGLPQPISPAGKEARRKIRLELAGEWNVSPQAVWIGNLAALVPHKDQATLIRAAADIRREIPTAEIFIIGDGPLRDELSELARSLGVEAFVHFTGRRPDPVHWLQALDLFVLSSWGEGMGSVLLEAMACRLPVVATAAGGIPEIVVDRQTGLLAPPRDHRRLAEAVVRMLRHPAEAENMAERASDRLPDFGVSRCGRLMEEQYELICNHGHNENR